MSPFEYSDEDFPFEPDTRTPAQKWLDAEMDKRWANEQGAEQHPILEAIALQVIEDNQRLRAVEVAARRVVRSFAALGNAQNAGALLVARANCETAMVALNAALVNTEAQGRR